MTVRLTTLPNELRGGAWPSPVRAVRYPVKSGNERDPRLYLPSRSHDFVGNTKGTAVDKTEEGAGKGRSVCPETPGLHEIISQWGLSAVTR
jgi:hypothetical protein